MDTLFCKCFDILKWQRMLGYLKVLLSDRNYRNIRPTNFVNMILIQIQLQFLWSKLTIYACTQKRRHWTFSPGLHCAISVGIWSYSDPYFLAFELNTEKYSASLCIQSECGKMQARITPNTNTFYTVLFVNFE